MNKILSGKNFSAIALVILGIIGLLFGWLALGITSILLIAIGIYSFIKKEMGAGIIATLIGIALIVLSGLLNRMIHYISFGCIILGIILFIVYYFSGKSE